MHNNLIKKLGIALVAVAAAICYSSLVDTDGNAVTNQTYLGNIDMGKGTAGDLQRYVITNGSDSVAANFLSLKGGLLTGPLRLWMDSVGGYQTAFSNNWILVDYGAAGEGRLELPLFAGDTKTLAVKSDIPDVSNFATMNYADNAASTSAAFAVSELARTNTVLNGGPYLTQHQSLEPATNYTDTVALQAKQYVDSQDSLVANSATNYSDKSIADFASTNSVFANAPYVQENTVTNTVKDILTNTVVVGYTDWVYTGDVEEGVKYSITSETSGSGYLFTLWNLTTGETLGTAADQALNPLTLTFAVSGGTITAKRSEIRRNANGLAMYSDVQALDTKLETMDTSYFRVVGITNKNQSVQYVYADTSVTELQIQMPESGMTKDWLVYVIAETNLVLKLPAANYWCQNESVTNDIPKLTPTAFYFSQITEDTFSIGRQELIPITVQSNRALMDERIKKNLKARRFGARRFGK